jgi:putative PIN family toxin of toxin-antitoxin system
LIVFFDTNVLISAFIAHGTSSEVFEYCLASCQVFTTLFVLEEIKSVLSSKIHLSPARIEEISGFLRGNLKLIKAGPLDEAVCRDPDDDFILSGALSAGADCLITGDEDLLVLGDYSGIRIIRPGDFWRLEKSLRAFREQKLLKDD